MSLFLRCNQVGGSVTEEQPGPLSPAGRTMHRFGQRFYHACVNVCRRVPREIPFTARTFFGRLMLSRRQSRARKHRGTKQIVPGTTRALDKAPRENLSVFLRNHAANLVFEEPQQEYGPVPSRPHRVGTI